MEQAAWDPGWYGGDQSIAVRLTDDFAFWRIVPEHFRGRERLVFASEFDHRRVVVGRGTISRIWHPVLGEIREIDTTGDNYRLYLADGTIFDVDQEQNAGRVDVAWAYDASGVPQPRRPPGVHPGRWRTLVEFEFLSELREPDARAIELFSGRRRSDRPMTLSELSQRHGVALAELIDAAARLGLDYAATDLLAAEDVDSIELLLGLERP